MQRPGLNPASLAAALLCLAGCGNVTGLNDYCSPNVTISSGATPQFSWAPSCRIAELSVASGTACQGRYECWSIASLGDSVEGVEGRYFERNTMPSPIRYGMVPPGAHELSTVIPLQVGQQYLVTLVRYEDYDGLTRVGVASRAFVP